MSRGGKGSKADVSGPVKAFNRTRQISDVQIWISRFSPPWRETCSTYATFQNKRIPFVGKLNT